VIQTGTRFGIRRRTRLRNGAVWSTPQTNKRTAHPRPTPVHNPLSRAGCHCRCPHPPMSSAAVLFLLRLLRRRFELHPSFTFRASSSRASSYGDEVSGAGGGGGRASPPHGERGREQRRGSPTTAPPQTAMVAVSSSPLPRSRWPEEAGGGGGLDAEDTILRRGE
jgi:hypothetical protein